MKRIWVIFLKEVTDNLRDRRSITSALVGTPGGAKTKKSAFTAANGLSLAGSPLSKSLVVTRPTAVSAPFTARIETHFDKSISSTCARSGVALRTR